MSGLKLKINYNSGTVASVPPTPGPTLSTPTAATPGGSRPKLKLTNNSSAPSTPVAAEETQKPKKTKAGRVPKVTAKLAESKKRVKEESDDEDDTIQVQPRQTKKLKFSISSRSAGPQTPAPQSATPSATRPITLKAKTKGKIPPRSAGEGYDSEASDREIDPVIEEQFVLRMVPGEDCEYVRQAIADKKIGIGKAMGGADVHMKFFSPNGRRAAITVRGNVYAAVLVDLPCIIEGMKSWDKRGWWKSADICQMLWVFKKVTNEDEATTVAIPSIVDPHTFQYPHGLTPPMHFARKRRFRKRISRTAIEAVEAAVEKLLKADMEATSTEYKTFGEKQAEASGSEDETEGLSDDDDAEGEPDDDRGYFNNQHHPVEEAVDDDPEADQLAADLEAEFAAELQEESVAATPMIPSGPELEDSGDESIEGESDEDDEPEDVEANEDEKLRLNLRQGIYDDIAELETSLAKGHNDLLACNNNILRRRIEESIRKIKAELQLKKASIEDGGEEDEDED